MNYSSSCCLIIIDLWKLIMTTKKQTTSVTLAMVFTISLVTIGMSNAYAMPVDDTKRQQTVESLVDEYGTIANSQFKAEKDLKSVKNSLESELAKKNINDYNVVLMQSEIDRLTTYLENSSKDLLTIQQTVDLVLQMDPKLEQQLETARIILLESQDIIPWSGLGTSTTSQAVEISIVDENPESYRPLIEELIGEDVPLIIKQGAKNPFTTCSARDVDCSNLQGGLRITKNLGGGICTLGFPVTLGTDQGFLTAGHCYALNAEVNQPYAVDPKIGEVTKRTWSSLGDTAFIKQTSGDTWDAGKIYSSPNSEFSGINTKVNPSSSAIIAMSGASSDFIDWGVVDSTNFTCSDGVISASGMYLTTGTQALRGDSGAPVFDPTFNVKKFYGTVSCFQSSTDNDMAFENWDTIVLRLGVS